MARSVQGLVSGHIAHRLLVRPVWTPACLAGRILVCVSAVAPTPGAFHRSLSSMQRGSTPSRRPQGALPMTSQTIEAFISDTGDEIDGDAPFQLAGERLLKINLNGLMWTKMGSMVAYTGDIKFTREGIVEHGVGKLLKRAVSGEGTKLTKAEGTGTLYLADEGKKVTILDLGGETLFVNGNDILAFEDGIAWDIKMMRKVTGMLAGGLFNVRLEGSGMIAITTHYDPLTLRVSRGAPVITDPNATVAWSGSLTPEFKTDISFKTFLGRGSGESIQMSFEGDGFVVIQPKEEVYLQAGTS